MKMKFAKTSLAGFLSLSLCYQARADVQQGAAAAAQAAGPVALSAALSSAGFATAMRAPCAAENWPTCAMMALAVTQVGLALIQKKGDSDSLKSLTSDYGNSNGASGVNAADPSATYTSPNGTTITGSAAQTANALVANGLGALANDYAADVKTLAAQGVTVSPDGSSAILKNGTKVSGSSLGSAQDMQAAGFSSSDIAGAQSALANVPKVIASMQSKVGSLNNDVGGGGGGVGAPGGGNGSGGGSSGYDPFARLAKKSGAKNLSDVAGLSKKLNGDNIGVEGDDIFEMITRRYQARDKVDTFLKK